MVTARGGALAALVLLGAWTCARSARDPQLPPPLRERWVVAQAEAQGSDGVATLVTHTQHAEAQVRAWALRGLGRVGPAAVEALAAHRPVTPEQVYALGLAQAQAGVLRQVLASWRPDTQGDVQVASAGAASPEVAMELAAVWSLARVGGREDLSALARRLQHPSDEVVAAAGVALGLWGRRELPLNEATRAQLQRLVAHASAPVRYGVAYAFAREYEPPPGSHGEGALATLVRDGEAEVRSTALMGLAQRGKVNLNLFLDRLADEDARVRVQAVRGLLGPHGSPMSREAVARWVSRRPLRPQYRHEILTAMGGLVEHATEPAVGPALQALGRRAARTLKSGEEPLLASAVHCLSTAAAVRIRGAVGQLETCGGAEPAWPLVERRRLLGDVIKGGVVADIEERLAIFSRLLAAKDPRVRAVALGAGLTAEDEELRAKATEAATRVLLESKHLVEVGAVADAAAGANVEVAPQLRAALLSRGRREVHNGDAELLLTLVAAFRALGIGEARDILVEASRHPLRPVRVAAQEAWEAIAGESLPPVKVAAAEVPPLHPQRALGRAVRWELTTTQGTVVIELWPAVAPWAVSTLMTLTERGYYTDLLWHRVVPDFVVQGGDPAGSGWGGPGFTLPGEPSWLPFDRGAVGIADAGLDTGGSQFFIMHSRAPHLEGRYTQVGRVLEGLDVVDRLMVGDRLLEAEISTTDALPR